MAEGGHGFQEGRGCCTNNVGPRVQLIGASARSLARCGWTRVASPRRATVATAVAHLQTASARVRLCAVNPSIPISHDSDGRRDRPFPDRPLPRKAHQLASLFSLLSSLSNDLCLASPLPSQAHWRSHDGLVVSSLAELESIQRRPCELSRLGHQTTLSMHSGPTPTKLHQFPTGPWGSRSGSREGVHPLPDHTRCALGSLFPFVSKLPQGYSNIAGENNHNAIWG